MSVRVRWSNGGEASVVSIAADAIELRSTAPAPPGSRLDGVADDGELPVRVKVASCRRDREGWFVVRGRPIDLARADRERIAASLAKK